MGSRASRHVATAAENRGATHEAESEGRLVARAADGDVGAFEALVRTHAGRLYGVLLRVTSDSGDAEDALQETFVRAWRGISKFERRSSFFTWLYRIGVNEAKRRLERRPPPQVRLGDDGALLDQVGDRRPLPHARAEQRELLVALDEAVRRLEPEYRLPLVLRDVEGFSTREAAVIMGLSEPAFKSRLHRARMSVREVLEPLIESEADPHEAETKSDRPGSKR